MPLFKICETFFEYAVGLYSGMSAMSEWEFSTRPQFWTQSDLRSPLQKFADDQITLG
jgi:hypothetical protein